MNEIDFIESSHVTSEIVYMTHSEEVLISYFRDVIVIKDLYLHMKMVESSRGLNGVRRFYEQLILALLCSVECLTTPIQH